MTDETETDGLLTCAACVHRVETVSNPDDDHPAERSACCLRAPHPAYGRPLVTRHTPACAEYDDGALPDLADALEPFARSWAEALQTGGLEDLPAANDRDGWAMIATYRNGPQVYQFWRDSEGDQWIALVADGGRLVGARL